MARDVDACDGYVVLAGRRPAPSGNQEAGASPARSRHCDRGATLAQTTAAMPEGRGKRRSESQETAPGGPVTHWDVDIPDGVTMTAAPTPARSTRLRTLAASAALLTGLTLAGCGSSSDDDSPASKGSSGGSSSAPVVVENCGQKLTFDKAPSRAIGYYQHPTELMLALGLQDKIVGTAYPDNPPLPEEKAAWDGLDLISKEDASFEQLVKKEPDFVYGGYTSAFDEKAGRSRKTFTDAGIPTYLDREGCSDKPVSMDQLYDEIDTIGKIFRVEDKATALVKEYRAEVDGVTSKVADATPTSVFAYDSGEDAPFTSGGKGMANEIIRLAGGTNVFDGIDKTWSDVSWEQVVKRQPQVIAIYDYYGTPSVAKKEKFLLSKPELADVPAIKNKRFVVLTLQDVVLGVRAPGAVVTVAKALHPDLVG
jgi:iron complex transport system substrate-binding protein